MYHVLITGATGFLGRAIVEAFQRADWQVTPTGFSRAGANKAVKLDLLDFSAVETLIKSTRPDFIVHSAAEISPDRAALDPDRARALNVDATANLTSISAACSIPMLYISTQYVFPGTPGEAPYTETAAPQPVNLYGQLKLEGEQATLSGKAELGAVLRVPIMYGRVDPSIGNKESAISILIDKVKESATKKVVVDDWARRDPASVEDISRCIVQVGDNWLKALREHTEGDFPRIIQFCAGQFFTKYEMCQIFADILGVDISKMEGTKSDSENATVRRPYDTHMSTKELERAIGGSLQVSDFQQWWMKELRP